MAPTSFIHAGDTILFQGDSITDCGRSREVTDPNVALGNGYASLLAADLLAARPADALRIFNRGISGNRIVDLDARIKSDVINLRPDVLSILIGVNDTWHEFGSKNGVAIAKYARVYRAFLEEVRAALPAIRLILCEPFVLPCGVVTADWVPDVAQRRAVVRELATAFDAVLVPFQSTFDAATAEAVPTYWAGDGVHPTPAGHRRMANAWLTATTSLTD
jgi:lysophospholipase L1-like esterase